MPNSDQTVSAVPPINPITPPRPPSPAQTTPVTPNTASPVMPPVNPIAPPHVPSSVPTTPPTPNNPAPIKPVVENRPLPPTPPSPPSPTSGSLPPLPNPPLPPLPQKPVEPPKQETPLPPPPTGGRPPESYVQKSPFRFLIPILGAGIIILIAIMGIQKLLASKSTSKTTSSTTTSSKVTTITYWGLWEPSLIMKETLSKFESQNPDIKVNYQQQSIKDYRERLQNAFKSGNGPDLFRFHVTWTPLLSSDLTAIPSTVMSAKEFEAQQYPVAQQWLQSSKGYMGIPLMYEGLGLFYNKTLFEAAGKTPPKTWEELRRLAIELTVKNKQGEIQQAGIALGTTKNVDNWSDILGLLMVQNAADPAKPNNDVGQGAVKFYRIFRDSDKVWDDTMPSSTIAFANSKAAMIIAPSWRALEVKEMNPNLEFSIAPLPQIPGGSYSWASFWVEGVSSHTDKTKQAAAWKLLSFLNQKEVLRDLYAAASKERLFGEMFARTDMADQLKTDPYMSGFLSQATDAKTWFLNSRTFDNGPNDKIIKYYEDALNAVDSNETLDKALETAEQGIAQIVTQYKLPSISTTK